MRTIRAGEGWNIVLFQNTAIALDHDKAARTTIYQELQEAMKRGEVLSLTP